ncbi:MAG: RNA pseudouridine synthase [Candidatus Cloacimonadota bacterium]|nr:MAG: RNA pseudouridine synthase [Candidatus Cloacimonadota bacterium]
MILYEDDKLLIIEKEPKLLVHATVDKSRKNLESMLEQDGNFEYFRLLNRIDFKTSGLVALSISEKDNKYLDKWLKSSKKTYLALVEGKMKSLKLEDFIKVGKNEVKIVKCGGKKAISEVSLIWYFKEEDVSLLEVVLVTGRRHQIRLQLANINHPIIGDDLYNPKCLNKEDDLFLHSHKLTWKDKTVIAEPPKYFEKYTNRLNHY